MRAAIILEGTVPVNAIVLAGGEQGDATLAFYAPNIQEVTGMDPQPGVGNGWSFVDGAWLPPDDLTAP